MMTVLRSPPGQTIAFLGGLVLLYLLLSLGDGGSELARSGEWIVWKATAALGLAVAVVLGWRGLWVVWAEKRALELTRALVMTYLGVALIVVVGLLALMLSEPVQELQWPIAGMWWRLRGVEWAAGLAAVPWLAVVWLALLGLREPPSMDVERSLGTLPGLRRAWRLLSECVFAFVTFVVIAIVVTGALRATWEAGLTEGLLGVDAQGFPATNVLLYGLYFSVLLAAITVPLLAAYRARGFALVDETYPLPAPARVTQDWVDSRARLQALLHLRSRIIRTPLAVFSVFTPLIAAALAYFVPELGG